ncbi:MAG TPA: radical SAM protein [Desulfobacterales bacterium]
MNQKGPHSGGRWLTAVVSDHRGRIFDLPGYAAVAMAAEVLRPLRDCDTCSLPHGSELMRLPDRSPVLFHIQSGRCRVVTENPFSPGDPLFPVAAFNSPGYVLSGICAYEEGVSAGWLPLFSYGAVGWHPDGFRTAAFQIDPEPRQDLRRMTPEKVRRGIGDLQARMPQNRLRAHLERCALDYGCPAAKNFFLGRYEAPLPTASRCNARCLGCLSLQPAGEIPHSQNRIDFTPTPQEIAEVAVAHIERVKRQQPVVSFGQGCEGEPLMAAAVIAPAIERIRRQTGRGTINLNTNGSRPDLLAPVLAAGLDSMRVSINSLRESCYRAYMRPLGYGFAQVMQSIELALSRDVFVSLNYLQIPGFTDTQEESEALEGFLNRYPIQMIQWRNLNFDPLRYWRRMSQAADSSRPMGMDRLLDRLRRRFPLLRHGYFNPPRKRPD